MSGVIDSIFGGGQGKAYQDMQNQLQQGMGERKNYQQQAEQALSPYMPGSQPGGLSFLQQYKQHLDQQQNAPEYLNTMLKGYKESPYAHQLQQQGQQALGSAAASSGMLGSGAYGKHSAQMAEDISNQDMQQYLNNVMGINKDYMQGMGHLNDQQYGASNTIFGGRQQLGQDAASLHNQMGQAQAGQDMAHGNAMQNILGTVATILGGPLGGMAMGGLSKLFGGGGGGGMPSYTPGQGMPPYRQ